VLSLFLDHPVHLTHVTCLQYVATLDSTNAHPLTVNQYWNQCPKYSWFHQRYCNL